MYLNPKLFLDPKEIEQIPAYQGFDEGLLIAGDNDKRIIALCSDPEESKKCLFAKEYPERFLKGGIVERSMFLVALGMARMNKIPFVLSSRFFYPDVNWEQIKGAMYYNDVPVKIVGSYTGLSFEPTGKEKPQEMEDIKLMRSIPAITILAPCDAIEAKYATIYAAQIDGPVYIRLARNATPVITTEETPFEIGKAEVFFRPDGDADVGVIATGPLVYNAIRAAKDLEEEGIRVRVLNLSTIKPMDTEAVINLTKQTGKIVVVEEHQVAGGVGSAVAEVLVETVPVPMRFVGIRDISGQSENEEKLMSHYGLDIENIKNVIRDINEN